MSMLELDSRVGREPRTVGGGGGAGMLVAVVVALLLLIGAVLLFGGEASDGTDVEQAPTSPTMSLDG